MHTYLNTDGGTMWTVGHYQIKGSEDFSSEHEWQPMKSFGSQHEAAAYVNYLNGGDGKTL